MDRVYFKLSSAQPERTANLLVRRGVPVSELKISDSSLSFWVPEAWRDRVRDTPGAAVEKEREKGIIKTLRSTKWRFMLYFGLISALTALVFISTTIWSIEVHGAVSVPEERIIADLRELGVHIFSPFWKIENRRLQNELLLREPALRWITLNLKGTKLFVLVREEIPAPEIVEPSPEPIRARRFGIITSAVALEGNAIVKPGDTVLAGDELIVPSERGAEGKVMARTFYEISAEMPVLCKLKLRERSEKTLTSLIIGEKRINFYNSNRHRLADYDTIECTMPLPFLPLRIERATLREYDTADFETDVDAAAGILRSRLASTLGRNLVEGSVVSERFTVSQEGGLVRVTLYAECRENIGEYYDRRTDNR